MSEDEGEFIEAKREEGTDDLLDDNSMAHLCDEDRLAVSGASTPGVDAPGDTPLQVRHISHLQFVDPLFFFEYRLYPHPGGQLRYAKFRLQHGIIHVTEVETSLTGESWHQQILYTKGICGPMTLYRDWRQPGENWFGERDNYSLFVSPVPVIDDKPVFTNKITGSGGDFSVLRIWLKGTQELLAGDFSTSGNRWTGNVSPSYASAEFDIIVEQSYPGYVSRHSESKKIAYLRSPRVTRPQDNAVIPLSSELKVEGDLALSGRIIQLTKENKTDELEKAPAWGGGGWEIRFNAKVHYPAGGWTVLNVRHIESGNDGWTQLRIFLLAPPTIDPIPAEVDINLHIEGGGHLDILGHNHSVEIFYDYGTEQLAGGWVVNGRWFADLVLTPGPTGITAKQFYAGIYSESTATRSFNVRPPQPTLNVEHVGGHTFLHGTGYNDTGFKVDVHDSSLADFLSADVVSGFWREQIPDEVLPGNYTLTCRQSVSDGNKGFIYSSGWVSAISFNLPTPQPTVFIPIVNAQIVDFLGTGHQWRAATVQIVIWRNGIVMDGVPKANVSPRGEWRTTSQVLDPGIYDNLSATQWVNGQHSAPIDVPNVEISSPPPGLDPIKENGFSPLFSGTCWPGATVHLEFSGNDQTYPVTDTDKDGRWEYTHIFSPGAHTVTVKQTFGGQTSGPVTGRFDIGLPQPVITWPKDEKVDYRVAVQGRGGHVGSLMKIVDEVSGKTLGEALVGKSAEWTVPLEELENSRYTIYAKATFGTVSSEHSDKVALEVVLMPPHINLEPEDSVPRTFRIEGTGRPSRVWTSDWTEIELWLNGQALPRFRVKEDGTWSHQETLPLGHYTLQAKQFHTGWESEFGPVHKVAVVPASPVMETPALGEPVGQRAAIAGFGYVGDSIEVALADALDVILGSTVVQENGTWWLWVTLTGLAGGHSLVARQSCGEFISAWSAPRPFVLRTEPPTFTRPEQGDWVSPMPPLAGLGKPDAAVHLFAWYDPDKKIATDVSVIDGQWATPPLNPLRAGPWWVRVCQTVAGELSDSVDSARFEVLFSDDRTDDKSA
jgi:hypothetical protein